MLQNPQNLVMDEIRQQIISPQMIPANFQSLLSSAGPVATVQSVDTSNGKINPVSLVTPTQAVTLAAPHPVATIPMSDSKSLGNQVRSEQLNSILRQMKEGVYQQSLSPSPPPQLQPIHATTPSPCPSPGPGPSTLFCSDQPNVLMTAAVPQQGLPPVTVYNYLDTSAVQATLANYLTLQNLGYPVLSGLNMGTVAALNQMSSRPSTERFQGQENLNKRSFSQGKTELRKRRRGSAENKVCKNCGTTDTPFWRKDKKSGLPLCNACGLYFAKNDADRPSSLWKADQKSED